MYPITLNFQNNYQKITDNLQTMGSVQYPIKIRIETNSGEIGITLNSLGKIIINGTGKDTPSFDEMNDVIEWALLILCKTISKRKMGVYGLGNIEKESIFDKRKKGLYL